MTTGSPPPATCPIGWQPQALAPVFFGARSLGPDDGAPVRLRLFFPSLDGAVESAPLLEGCGRYPLVLFCHGHCTGDAEHYRRWFRIPAQLARAGYVVAVPHLAGNAGGSSPSIPSHPDEATLDDVATWLRSDWGQREVLLPPPATAVVGHSFGALLGARYAVGRPVSAYAGLSGTWHDWFGDEPFPLPRLRIPTLLVWGGAEFFAELPDAQWQAMVEPRHRLVVEDGEHWDYLEPQVDVPCRNLSGACPHVHGATADLLTMFLARYVPPELGTDLPDKVPGDLEPPALDLTLEQEFFAGGYLGGYAALTGSCAFTNDSALPQLVANRRTRETHSLDRPCAWVSKIAARNRRVVSARPAGYHWCDFCFPALADG